MMLICRSPSPTLSYCLNTLLLSHSTKREKMSITECVWHKMLWCWRIFSFFSSMRIDINKIIKTAYYYHVSCEECNKKNCSLCKRFYLVQRSSQVFTNDLNKNVAENFVLVQVMIATGPLINNFIDATESAKFH